MKLTVLAARLAAGPTFKPLPRPGHRVLRWLAAAAPFWVLGTIVFGVPIMIGRLAVEPLLVIEQLAIVATAVSAALAAFASTIPAGDLRWVWLPLPSLAVWVAAAMGRWIGGLGEEGTAGAAQIGIDSQCLIPEATIGVAPALIFVAMLRRGAPLRPRTTFALAGLALGAFVASGLELFHLEELDLTALVWHFGMVATLMLAGYWSGPDLLRWWHSPTLKYRQRSPSG